MNPQQLVFWIRYNVFFTLLTIVAMTHATVFGFFGFTLFELCMAVMFVNRLVLLPERTEP